MMALAVAAACGGGVEPADDDGAQGGGGPGGGGPGGQGAGSACDYADETSSSSVTVRVTNNRTTPIYLDQQCTTSLSIEIMGVAHAGEMPVLANTCQQALAGAQPPCCDCFPMMVEIAPGDSWQTTWSGLLYESRELPAECVSQGGAVSNCIQAIAATAGSMKAIVHLYGSVECDGGDTYCWPSAPIDAEGDFELGVDATVELTVD